KLYSNLDWLPTNLGVGQPIVKPKGIDDVPIVALTLWTEDPQRSADDLSRVAHTLETELKRVAGTRDLYTIGAPDRVVRVLFDPERVSYPQLLTLFWERHDPTQGMRQGNDLGTQYRSAIYCFSDAQLAATLASRDQFQQALQGAGLGRITTEIALAGPFYYAEPYHQQYLDKNPGGYCGLKGTGVSCPV
ncbi:MAG TPA: peptide-methionine (S)-S-oxide reductase MsrA, partial [Pseudomonadales bacterium]|nr:peptide-methionine (S)-S-oxide reductase MsrA [Pseudomonadales bacterium]